MVWIWLRLRRCYRIDLRHTVASQGCCSIGAELADAEEAMTISALAATLDATPPPHIDMTHMKADAHAVLARQLAVALENAAAFDEIREVSHSA